MTRTAALTAEDLLRLNLQDKRSELVKGVLVVREPAGYRHGQVAAKLATILLNHAEAHSLGAVFAAETGFKLASDPDTVRAPDVAFVRRSRLPDPPPSGYAAMAPDLAVEVLSPGDRPGEVLANVADWLEGGSALVWVVDPTRRTARVYRRDGSESLLTQHDALEGEDVLPELTIPLASLA